MGTPFVRDGTWTSTYNTGDPALKRWAIIGTDVARVYPRTVRGSSFKPGPFYPRAIPPKIAQRGSAGKTATNENQVPSGTIGVASIPGVQAVLPAVNRFTVGDGN